LEWLWPKLVPGGIVVFDDYGFQFCDGVTQLVNEERIKKDRIVIHNLNGHAILIKI
jgi:O-methyltransferase